MPVRTTSKRPPNELARIMALPAMDHFATQPQGDYFLTEEAMFLPAQAACIVALEQTGALIADVPVGGGKTLVALLAAGILGYAPEDTLLLLEPKGAKTLDAAIAFYSKHFALTVPAHVMTYNRLQGVKGAAAFHKINPKLVIADEAHNLCNRKGRRLAELRRWAGPDTALVAMSGTWTKKSVVDSADVFRLALGSGSPLPLSWNWQARFDKCMSEEYWGDWPTKRDWDLMEPLAGLPNGTKARREALRLAWQERFKSTPGCVVYDKASYTGDIIIQPFRYTLNARTQTLLTRLEEDWIGPDGQELTSPLLVYNYAMQLSLGFYYRQVPDDRPGDWAEARLNAETLARELGYMRRRGLETLPRLMRKFRAGELTTHQPSPSRTRADRTGDLCLPPLGQCAHGHFPILGPTVHWVPETLHSALAHWDSMSHWPEPEKVTVVTDPGPVQAMAKLGDRPLRWYTYEAVAGQALGEVLPLNGPDPVGRRGLWLSIGSYGAGRNLQTWDCNVLDVFPSDVKGTEQLMGRTARNGQTSPQVTYFVNVSTKHLQKALDTSLSRAHTDSQNDGRRGIILGATVKDTLEI